MALFMVRPSRGAWAFFGLVALAAAGARGYDRRERSIARRDGPIADVALDLARCVYGADTVWLLDDTGPTRQTDWSLRMADWLRNAATSTQPTDWPGRCAPQAEHLAARLESTPAAPEHSPALARAVASDLQSITADPIAFLNAADGEALAGRMATLMAQVREMSSGAAGRWDRDAPVAPTGMSTARLVHLARLLQLAPFADRPVLLGSSDLTYRAITDGSLHLLEFTGTERTESLLGPSIPLREAPMGELARVETDDGPMLVRLSPVPRLVAFPSALAQGSEGMDTWEATEGSKGLGLLSTHNGSVFLRATQLDGPTSWTAPLPLGAGESALAAVVSADHEGTPGVFRVTELLPRVDDAVVQQFVVEQADDGTLTPAGGPVQLLGSVPAFGARVTTCASGTARYFVVASESVLSVIRVQWSIAHLAQLSGGVARGRNAPVVCDEHRVVVGTEASSGHGAWQAFDFPNYGATSVTPLDPPVVGPNGKVEAVALVHGSTVAVVSNRVALRTFVQGPERGPWHSNGLVALLSPARGPLRTLSRVSVVGGPQQMALLLEGSAGPRPPPERPHAEGVTPTDPPDDESSAARQPLATPFTTLLVSSDEGRSFTTP